MDKAKIVPVTAAEAERLKNAAFQWQKTQARCEAARTKAEARKKAEVEAKRREAEREVQCRRDSDRKCDEMATAAARRMNGGKPSRAERRHARLVAEFCAF